MVQDTIDRLESAYEALRDYIATAPEARQDQPIVAVLAALDEAIIDVIMMKPPKEIAPPSLFVAYCGAVVFWFVLGLAAIGLGYVAGWW